MKVYVDDIPELMEAARRFTASLGWNDGDGQQPAERPDFYEGIDPWLSKAKRERIYLERLQEWMREQRRKALRQFDLKVLVWLAELDDDEQGRAIWQMHQEGIILDPAKVDDMIADWHASLTPGSAQPTEARKMSDDVLDRWTQYVHIDSDLLDDPDSIWAEEWPDIK